ncbi:ATP-binding cassette domain-containing protein [Rhizobium pusense]|jgi:D-xylose transport system ATP-binding protein|uniref:ABC transporter family protein n=3 Tax=Hyphomicrobiales TaxID=356 RepID=A0A256GD44_9HYPH|nr:MULTISPECIES: ATP-binding cassette domain-containing protein [Hyphomicrobiales]EGP54274.1 xylose ABC transporter, ATP-binding protein [Agrobacterium tumefaciens F2]QCM13617.1 sugar ABC transporter ATP-binding protein [Agrobacterium tumefaciens]KAB2701998.1 sugar ABC transporter ATP-binding protein [Brucella lupini]KNY31506.1 ABC transporter ATP-binding protein [Agrobacterium sp. SUL3]MCD4663605.1 ATP-binding cassette domain-containing protein [Agrobacterium sp.]
MTNQPLIELQGISKAFGGVQAVDDASLTVYPGEVVGLLGHNGAGKSTLIRILSGAYVADSGRILVGGEEKAISSPKDAKELGIETIYQTLALADNLDAVANLFLGREKRKFGIFNDRPAMVRDAVEICGQINPRFKNLQTPVRNLSGGQRQTIAIARAVYFNARVLIMDEPTAALGPGETAMVKELIQQLKRKGVGIILISHDIDDVFDLADRMVVMAAGRVVGRINTAEATREQVLSLIIMGAETKTQPAVTTS